MDNNKFVVRKRLLNRRRHYWVGRIINDSFVPYSDIFNPTGYSHPYKAEAIEMAKEIEERLGGHISCTDNVE